LKVPTANKPPLIADGQTLGVIGAGVMGRTLLQGLFDSGAISQEEYQSIKSRVLA